MTAPARLAAAEGFVIDVDGCLMLSNQPGGLGGGRVIAGAGELIADLRRAGRRIVICTNASNSSPARLAGALQVGGIEIEEREVLTPLVAGSRYLAHQLPGASVLALGGPSMRASLEGAGISLAAPGSTPDAVFVGFAEAYQGGELAAACLAVEAGAPFLVTALSPWYAAGGGRAVGLAGTIAAGIRYVTGVEPTVVGKPSSILMEAAAQMLAMPPERIAVVGDDPVAEVGMGRAHGAATVLVLSGITGAEAVEDLPEPHRPDLVVADVEELRQTLFGDRALEATRGDA